MHQPPPTMQRPTRSYSLPTVALVLSIGGLCICISSAVGVILGIISLVRIGREPQLPGRGKAIAAIIIGAVLVPFQLGVLAAIAIPNFIRFQARSKQSECKMALREIYRDQVAYRVDHGRYATRFSELGFQVTPGNRYAYLLSEGEVIPVWGYVIPEGNGSPTSLEEAIKTSRWALIVKLRWGRAEGR